MLSTSESETEILLDNKQLLGIFFVVAVLLGVAFYGGYMVGRGATGKKTVAAGPVTVPPDNAPAANPNPAAGETHSFPADTGTSREQSSAASNASVSSVERSTAEPPEEPPLGSRKRNDAASEAFAPQSGEQYLQVAAVGRDEADAIANVLNKKGFRAHAVPKPGNSKIYRVLIGPVRDTADLSSTRDALRRTGFREVIVQRY